MLSCQQITELVTGYAEGRLPVTRRLAFEMHIAMCANCRVYVSQLRQTVKALGHLPDEPIPDDVMVALTDRFADWAHGDPEQE